MDTSDPTNHSISADRDGGQRGASGRTVTVALLLDRHLVLAFLADVQSARWDDRPSEEGYADQYDRLLRHLDAGSSLERDFVEALFARDWRLPNLAQHCPASDVAVQVDFFDRTPVPGLCIFVDAPAHDRAQQEIHDRQVRAELKDRGFRIVVIRYDQSIDDQLDALREILAS